jgi:hypothetical protein
MRKLLIGALLLPVIVRAQSVRVTGVTFDSLSGRPLAVAFITLGSKSTMADSIGRFAFDSVTPGTYRVTMQHDLLDSLGLSGVVTSVVVTDGMPPIRVATPSVMTMWRRVCRGEAPPDSGFVFGTVLDAATRAPVRGAPIIATWIELRTEARSVNAKEFRLESATTDDGSFVLCGVPLGVGVRLHSARDSVAASSLDMLLSQAAPVRRQDLSLGDLRSRGTVRGSVLSAGKGVPNAHVTIGASPEVTTNANGQFIARNVVAGTQQIEVQGIGFNPTKKLVNVPADDTLQVSFEIEKIVTLDSVTVRGSAVRQRLATQFERRKNLGVGYFRDSLELAKHQSFEGVFGRMPSVMLQRARGRPTITVGIARACGAVIFVDRMRSDVEHLLALRPSDLGGLEIYRAGELPSDLATLLLGDPMKKPCAVVAWTKMGWR